MGALLDIDDVCAGHPKAKDELDHLRELAAQRGARLQILRDAMREVDWYHFLYDHPEAADWFDKD